MTKKTTKLRTKKTTKTATKKKKGTEKKSRAYEGAAKGKRLSRWKTTGASANTEVLGGLVTLRNRARDLRRNNPYARRGIEAITSNVVGHGIQTQFREARDVDFLEVEWKHWAETTAIDFDGRNDIYGLQRLIMDAVVESGEVLVRKRYNAALNFPLQYQVLESDFIDTNKNEVSANGNRIIQGIEFTPEGKREAYWLYEAHPGSYDPTFGDTVTSNRIPVSEVYHLYRMERPGQARGVTWLAPCIIRLKDLDDFEDAHLVRQKIAACFTAFVRDIQTNLDEDFDPTSEQAELSARLEPGIIEHLPPGKEIQFSSPPELQNYEQYVKTNLHGIAAGLGVTYEVLANDYSNVNFSSGRMGWIEMFRNIRTWQENVMILQFLTPVSTDFLNVATIKGHRTEKTVVQHIPPKREMIDPTKEIPAAIDSIRAGLSTLSDELLAQGKDPVEHLKQYQADMKNLDKLKLIVEADPRNPVGGPKIKNDSEATPKKETKGAKSAA